MQLKLLILVLGTVAVIAAMQYVLKAGDFEGGNIEIADTVLPRIGGEDPVIIDGHSVYYLRDEGCVRLMKEESDASNRTGGAEVPPPPPLPPPEPQSGVQLEGCFAYITDGERVYFEGKGYNREIGQPPLPPAPPSAPPSPATSGGGGGSPSGSPEHIAQIERIFGIDFDYESPPQRSIGKYWEIVGANPNTFEVLNRIGYARDDARVYYRGMPMDIDSASFRIVSALHKVIADKDGAYVIHGYWPPFFASVEGADGTLRSSGDYYIDSDNAFMFDRVSVFGLIRVSGPKQLKGVSAEGFTQIDESYAKNLEVVLYKNSIIQDADPGTFEVFTKGQYPYQGRYARDARYVYFDGAKIEGSDGPTFSFLNEGYAKDANQVYYAQGKIFEGVDAETFELLSIDQCNSYSRDKDHVYYAHDIVPWADPATTERADPESGDTFRDKDSVWYHSSYVDGCSPPILIEDIGNILEENYPAKVIDSCEASRFVPQAGESYGIWEPHLFDACLLIRYDLRRFNFDDYPPIKILELADITGDGIQEALIHTGERGASNVLVALMSLQDGRVQYLKYGTPPQNMTFREGGSVRLVTDVVLAPDINSVYVDKNGIEPGTCNSDAYTWNPQSRIFEVNPALAELRTAEMCQ